MKSITSEEKKSVIDLMTRYMQRYNLSQREMAKKLNVSPSALSLWLRHEGTGLVMKNVNAIRFICREVDPNGSTTPPPPHLNIVEKKAEEIKNYLITAMIDADISKEALKEMYNFFTTHDLKPLVENILIDVPPSIKQFPKDLPMNSFDKLENAVKAAEEQK